jgi:hypothetical protein
MMYYYSCPNGHCFLSTVLVNIRIERKWLSFWYGTISVWQIGRIPPDDDTISATSIQKRWNYVLWTCRGPGDVCIISWQHAPTLLTFISCHVLFAATIAANMCISSYSTNSCVTRIFVYAQHIILHTILISSSCFTIGPKVYNKIFCSLSIPKHISNTRQCPREEGGIPKMNHGLNNHHHQWLGACPYSTKTIVLYGQL